MKYKVYKLKNGLQVVLHRQPFAHSLYLDLIVKVGSRYENLENNGTAHLIEHIFSKKIIDALQNHSWIKSYINDSFYAYTNEDRTNYEFKLLKNDLSRVWQVISSVIFGEGITARELQFEKSVIREELEERKSDYLYIFDQAIKRKLYKNNPLRFDPLGSEKSIGNLSLLGLRNFLADYYTPSNMILSISGDFSFSEILTLLEKKIPSNHRLALKIPTYQKYSYRGDALKIINKKQFKQGYFSWHLPYFLNLAENNVKLEFFMEVLNNYLFYKLSKSFSFYSLDVNLRSFSEFADCYIETSMSSDKVQDFYVKLLNLLMGFYKSFKARDLHLYQEKKLNSLIIESDNQIGSVNIIAWYLSTYGVGHGFDLESQKEIIKSITIADMRSLFAEIFFNRKGLTMIFAYLNKSKQKEIEELWEKYLKKDF